MAGPPPMQTLKKNPVEQAEPVQQTEIAPAPNIMQRAPMLHQMLPTPEQMSDEELELYLKRLTMRHKRLSRKWWGLRRKYGKNECPYCGMHTEGGFCAIHQRDYDEYLTALATRQNRGFGL
jgi:hypothetical protein|tara:strand:+ start:1843 stop:2205 length:363 start_codon:yes stop_codon:yes gene_type:complete